MRPSTFVGVVARAGGVVGGGADPLPLDSKTPLGVYGLKKLKSSATNAIRVRRSSDNTEQDIGFVETALDTAALATFCGANSGFVVTWYDQSGDTRNITQSTTTLQPRIVNSGVYDDSAVFDGSNDFLSRGARLTSGALSVLTLALWVKPASFATYRMLASESVDAPIHSWVLAIDVTTGKVYFQGSQAGTTTWVVASDTGLTLNVWTHIAIVYSASAVRILFNGTAIATSTIGSVTSSVLNGSSAFRVGSYATPEKFFYSGPLRDVVVDQSAYTDAEILALYEAGL